MTDNRIDHIEMALASTMDAVRRLSWPSGADPEACRDKLAAAGRSLDRATAHRTPRHLVAVEPGGCAPPVLVSASPVLIALTANAMGAGKSAVANHLVEHHGFTLVKLAGPLKAMTRALLAEIGIAPHAVERFVEGSDKEIVIPALGISCRRLMQLLGTEFGRDLIHPDIWARLTAMRCQRLLDQGQNVVIDDMRYPNELDAVVSIGAYVVRIERPGLSDATGHSSEGGLADVRVNHYIVNAGSLAGLCEMAGDLPAAARRHAAESLSS